MRKKAKSSLFNHYALKQLSGLLCLTPPPGDPNRGRGRKWEEFQVLSRESDDVVSVSLHDYVLEVLTELCTSFQHGVCYRTKTESLLAERCVVYVCVNFLFLFSFCLICVAHTLIHWYMHSLTLSQTLAHKHSVTDHSLTVTHSLTHLPTHSLAHSLTRPLTHCPLTCPLTHCSPTQPITPQDQQLCNSPAPTLSHWFSLSIWSEISRHSLHCDLSWPVHSLPGVSQP